MQKTTEVTKGFKVAGSASYLPGQPINNTELEKIYGVPATFSKQRSGVETRHIARGESGGEMGAKVVQEALRDAGLKVSDIDLLISASGSFDYIIPNQATVIKSFLKGSSECDFPAMCVNSVCTGFITALDTAARYFQDSEYKTIVIVNAEIAHRFMDPDNWETNSLFGDAATAFVLQRDDSKKTGMIKSMFKTYSSGVHNTIIEGGANKYPIKDYPYDPKLHSFRMDGVPLLKLAKQYVPQFMHEFFTPLQMKVTDVDAILPHQASKYGLQIFKDLYDLKPGQVLENLSKYGNCISASIPLLLHDARSEGRIHDGHLYFLSGTSAGFSISGILIKL